jgi:hypothetical protein
MEQLIYILLGVYPTLLLLWVLYVFTMALKRAKENGLLHPVALVIGSSIAAPAYILDIAVNLTIGTVLFLDFPREWTLSARMSRLYVPGSTAWRSKLSAIFAVIFLDPFDPNPKGHID